MIHNHIMPREQLVELITYLATAYPKTFFIQPYQKRPLKKNIVSDLEKEGVLDDDKRTAAISFYMNDWNYQARLQAGSKRVDLNGKEVGTVTELEALEAQTRLRTQKAARRVIQDPITVARNLHTNGKISTDQLSKITAPAMERTPMTKAAKIPQTNGADLQGREAAAATETPMPVKVIKPTLSMMMITKGQPKENPMPAKAAKLDPLTQLSEITETIRDMPTQPEPLRPFLVAGLRVVIAEIEEAINAMDDSQAS